MLFNHISSSQALEDEIITVVKLAKANLNTVVSAVGAKLAI